MDLMVSDDPPAGKKKPSDEPPTTLMSLGLQFKWKARK